MIFSHLNVIQNGFKFSLNHQIPLRSLITLIPQSAEILFRIPHDRLTLFDCFIQFRQTFFIRRVLHVDLVLPVLRFLRLLLPSRDVVFHVLHLLTEILDFALQQADLAVFNRAGLVQALILKTQKVTFEVFTVFQSNAADNAFAKFTYQKISRNTGFNAILTGVVNSGGSGDFLTT